MADRYLLESGAPDGYQLEDGSGVLLNEEDSFVPRGVLAGAVLAVLVGSWSQPAYSVVDFPTGTEEGAAPVEVVPYRARVNDSIITRAWEPLPQPQQRQPKVAAFTPQGDEVRRASQASLYADLHSRWITDWKAQRVGGVAATLSAQILPKPRDQAHILASWDGLGWKAQRAGVGVPAAEEVAVVPPGRFQRQIIAAWSEPVYSLVEYGQGTEEGVTVVPDQPWAGNRWLSNVVGQWQVTWAAQRSPITVTPSLPYADQPPKLTRPIASIVEQWVVTWGAQKAPDFTAEQPITKASPQPHVVGSWPAAWWGSQRAPLTPQVAPAVVDDPPPWVKPQQHIVDSWRVPVYSVVEYGMGTEEGVAAQADDPPPRSKFQSHIFTAWEPLKYRAEKFGAAIELPVEQPAWGRPWLTGIVEQWKVDWRAQRAPVRIVQGGVDQPPRLVRSIAPIVAQWEVTWGAQKAPDFTEAGAAPAADQPWPGRPWLAGVLDSWRVTWGAQRRPVTVTETGPVVEQQVPYRRLPGHLFASWEPPYYSVIECGTATEEGAAPAGTDQPWPGHRWLASVSRQWESKPYRGERFGAVIDLTTVTPTPTDETPPRYYGHRDVTVEEVQQQWELLEIKRRIREDPGPLETKVYTEVSVPKVLHKAVRDAIRIDLHFAPSLRAPSSAAPEPKIEEKKGLTREQIIALVIALDDDD